MKVSKNVDCSNQKCMVTDDNKR